MTKEGLRSIEEIQPGDLVHAKNTDTGERGWKRVVRLFLNESEELIHIHVGGEEIIATPDHPFWVEGRGFIAAACLKPGDRVETTEGEILTITRVEREVLDAPIPVYNFEVEDWHTYYVSEEKVLVHNMCSVGVGIGRGSTTIHNDILDSPRVGSALKVDDVKPIYTINKKTGKPQIVKEFPATAQSHGFNDIIDNYAGYATKTQLNNATLYQLDGSLNGVAGRFEWIIQDGNVAHRMFIQNGIMNGVPIKP